MRQSTLGALGAFVMGFVLFLGGAYQPRNTPEWLLVIPLAVACAGVVVRRRAPMAALGCGVAALGLDVAFGPSLGTMLVLTDNLYSAALYGPVRYTRWILTMCSILAVVFGAVYWYLAQDWRALAVMLIQAGLVLVIPVTTAMVLRQQRDQATAERVRAEQVARLAELDREAAITAERTRMARELHDMIANHFSAIAIQSTAALSRKDLDPATIRKIMESVRENSVQGMTEMRSMIGLLRSEGDDSEATRPRVADVGDLVERARTAGVEAKLTVVGEPRGLPVSVDLAGYRIVQEALTNAMKHGDHRATVDVVYGERDVTLTVDNPVNGRRAGLPGSGAGLIGMRERAALVGGDFEAGPRDAGGWRVRARLPMDEESG
ncbi:sensor histidine kinase [Nonomuraea sp. NPDC050556]|uniref:sensor histidine kinase n=1 Tax=Nonomuraea sp. NPDC050556 TaxID=3364369 RepID=UPI00379EB50D